MLDTIPFKRHPHNQPKSKRRKSRSTSITKKPKLHVWQVVAMILMVAVAGIAILQFTRAAVGDVGQIPNNLSDIQNSISTLTIKNATELTITDQEYVEYTYTPTSGIDAQKVALYIDNKLVSIAGKSPYHFIFDSQQYSNGAHTVDIVVFDSDTQPVTVLQRNLVINNPLSPLDRIKNIVTYPVTQVISL